MTSLLKKQIPTPILIITGAVPLGFWVTLIILALLTGPVNALALYLGSFICTGGVALIVWIPLWFGVGSITIALLTKWQNSRKPKTEQSEVAQVALSYDQTALTDYIRLAKQQRVDDYAIFSLLRRNGWDEPAIYEAFKVVESHR